MGTRKRHGLYLSPTADSQHVQELDRCTVRGRKSDLLRNYALLGYQRALALCANPDLAGDQSSLTRPFAFMLAAPAGEPVPPATPKESDEVAALKKRLADLEAQQKRWAEEREKEKQTKVAPPPLTVPTPAAPSIEARGPARSNVRLRPSAGGPLPVRPGRSALQGRIGGAR